MSTPAAVRLRWARRCRRSARERPGDVDRDASITDALAATGPVPLRLREARAALGGKSSELNLVRCHLLGLVDSIFRYHVK
jgi:hypothetical protein